MGYIQGTNGNDDLLSGRNADHLDGGAGDDTLTGNAGADTLEGGKGDDELEGGKGGDTFLYALGDGNDTITDYTEEDIIKFTSGTPKITTKGNNVIFTVGTGSSKGTVTVLNAKKNGTVITYVDSDGVVHEYPRAIEFDDKVTKATLLENYNKDTFNIVEYSNDHDNNYDNVKTIDASAVEQDIHIIGNTKANTMIGSDNNDTIEGGKGNDVLTGGEGADTFLYNKGDGNDKILDYESGDELQIVGDSVSKFTKSKDGKDYVVTLASKKTITLVGAADKVISYTDSKNPNGAFYPQVFDVNSKGTAVTLKAEYTADKFDVTDYADFSETARTIDASAVDQDLSIVGNKKNNVIIGADGNNSIEAGKGNDTITGGSGKNVFIFNPGDGKNVITNYKGGDIIKATSGKISVSKSGSNYVLSVGGTKVTLLNASKKYIRVSDEDGTRTVPTPLSKLTYTDANGGTIIIGKGYTGDSFDVNDFESDFAGKVFDITATAVKQDIHIVGNKLANNITGSDNNDTIEGGKGNDNLTGGDGADVFVYNKGDGNDKILDYENEDEIQIVDDTVKNITKSGSNFVINLASKKKITIVGGANKTITYTDAANPDPVKYPEPFAVNSKGTAVSLLSAYSADKFDVNDYEEFGETARTINASQVDQDLHIVGNKKNNVIIGADGNNSIEGGKGNDTLTGGTGKNTFIFNSGDGSDVITNYKGSDVIKATSGKITGKTKGSDFVLSISGGGKVTLQGAGKKYVRVTDGSGTHWADDDNSPLKKITYKNHNVSLHSGYTSDSFVADDYTKDLPGKVFDIDASDVKHAMTIVGNKEKNNIIGTDEDDYIEGLAGADKLYGNDGNDSLWGGAGNDTLYGGDGNDTFIYTPGEGKDVISDFTKGDQIMILSGDSYKKESASGDDVTFTFSSGQILVQGGAEKAIKFVDSNGKTIDTYTPD